MLVCHLNGFSFLMLMLRLLYKNMLHLCFFLNPDTSFGCIGIRNKFNKSLVSTHDLIGHFLNRIKLRKKLDYSRLDTFASTSFWKDYCKIKNDCVVYFSVLKKCYVAYWLWFCQIFLMTSSGDRSLPVGCQCIDMPVDTFYLSFIYVFILLC